MIATLHSDRPLGQVRAALPGTGDRFTLRHPRAPLVELAGRMRTDGAGTRLVADARVRSVISFPVTLVLGLLVLVSFSEPVVFVAVALVGVGITVVSVRLAAAYRRLRVLLLEALAADVGATLLPPRERGRPR